MGTVKKDNTLVRITTVPLSLEKLLTGQMRFMSEHGFNVYMISSPSENAEQLEKKELSSYLVVQMSRQITPFKDLVALVKLISLLIRIKPDIVHTHTPKAGFLGMLASRLAGVPVRLHTIAGLPLLEARGIKRKVLEAVEKLTYHCASKVYPNSRNLEQIILDAKFCKRSKLKVIGNGSSNGIDTAFFKCTPQLINEADGLRKRHSIPDGAYIYIFIGRLVRDKGIEELVEAFSFINRDYKNTWLFLVGPVEHDLDPLSDRCYNLIEHNSQIISAGYQNDVRPYLALSDVLVFPSYREGFPNVPMQAGCFELPSIVTNINGCNEIIEDQKNGLIVPVKNIDALKRAMEQILTNKDLYARLKSNARKMILERYEQKVVWNLILNEYQDQLKSKRVIS
ncbi:MAG: glycosyltransferase family 4 protein [Mucilaginibacter sp.]